MANALLLNQIAQSPGFNPPEHYNALNQQNTQFEQRNALFNQGQEDRQRGMAEQEREQQLMGPRNDFAMWAMAHKQSPEMGKQVWAQIAPKYQEDPNADAAQIWAGFAQRNSDFLPKEIQGKVMQEFFASKPQEPYTLSPGSVRFGPDGKEIASVPAAPQRPLASDNAVVPVADPSSATGFKYVRRTDAAGKPAPAPRALTSGKYSPKELQGARDKLRAIGVAKQQLANLKAQRDNIKNSFSSGPGAAYLAPLSESGSNFDAAIDQMRDTITTLTRTPGVGAMSDFETRLSQAKLPSRNEYESSRDQKIKGLEDFINNLEVGYQDLLSDGQQPANNGGDPNAVDPQDLLDAADAILNGP